MCKNYEKNRHFYFSLSKLFLPLLLAYLHDTDTVFIQFTIEFYFKKYNRTITLSAYCSVITNFTLKNHLHTY